MNVKDNYAKDRSQSRSSFSFSLSFLVDLFDFLSFFLSFGRDPNSVYIVFCSFSGYIFNIIATINEVIGGNSYRTK